MGEAGLFVEAGLAFLLQCTALYQGLKPNTVLFDFVIKEGQSINRYQFEGGTMTSKTTLDTTDFGKETQFSGIQIQMEEDGENMILGGQLNVEDNCRPFVAKGNVLKPRSTLFQPCAFGVVYMLDKKLYFIKCQIDSSPVISHVTDLEGKAISGEQVLNQRVVPCRRGVAVSPGNKVFAYDSNGCKRVGADIKTWGHAKAAVECEIDEQIKLVDGKPSKLYSLHYLWLLFKKECPDFTERLSLYSEDILTNAYVRLLMNSSMTTKKSEPSDNGLAVFLKEKWAYFVGGSAGVVVILVAAVFLLLYCVKPRAFFCVCRCCKSLKRRRLGDAKLRGNNNQRKPKKNEKKSDALEKAEEISNPEESGSKDKIVNTDASTAPKPTKSHSSDPITSAEFEQFRLEILGRLRCLEDKLDKLLRQEKL